MKKKFPGLSLALLTIIVIACMASELLMTKDPAYMDLARGDIAPCREFLFGTDAMGRDIFSMIWYGGRGSLLIGFGATLISTVIGILVGSVSGYGPSGIAADGYCTEHSGPSSHGLFAGRSWRRRCFSSGCGDRPDGLDESGQSGADGGFATEKHRFCTGLQMPGRGIFSYSAPPPCAQLCGIHSVHGGNECEKRHCGGIHFKLYGDRPASGSDILGEYAFSFGKRHAFPLLVDGFYSRRIFGGDSFMPDKFGKLYEKKHQQTAQ